MSNLIYFRLDSTFPLSHVTVTSVNERLRGESLIILRFERMAKSKKDIKTSYVWSYRITCRWTRDRLIGETLILTSHPLAPNLHPICGVYLTPDLFNCKKLPLGSTDNDWCKFLSASISTAQTLTVSNVTRKSCCSRVPNGKGNRAIIMKYVGDHLKRSDFDVASSIWIGPSYGIPLWALVLTDYIFGICERHVLKYYEVFASCVTPTFGADDICHKLLRSARHVCFASRTIAIDSPTTGTKQCRGNLSFSNSNGTLVVNCEMTKVIYSYHCAKWLRFLKWEGYDEVFQRYRESIFEVIEVETGKVRLAFGWTSQRLLKSCSQKTKIHLDDFDELPFLLQFTDEDLLWDDEYSIPCTEATTALLRECQTRIPFKKWKNKYKIARIIFQINNANDKRRANEDDIPRIVEFDPRLEPFQEWYLKGQVFVKMWMPSKSEYSELQKPLQYALATCRMENCRALQIKPPNLDYKKKRDIPTHRETGILAYGSTPYSGPNIETVFDRTDQTLEVKYYDIWGRRDFFTVGSFIPT